MRREIWPLGIRLLHWLLAASMIMAFVTHDIDGPWHEWPGYVALVAAALRLVWGCLPATSAAPARYSRFADFLRSPAVVWANLLRIWHKTEPRFLGHSPAAGWLVLLLLLVSVGAGISGWMLVTDQFFGVAWVMTLHEVLGHTIVPLVLLHWAAVAYGSWRHRENLLLSMVKGRKEVSIEQRH